MTSLRAAFEEVHRLEDDGVLLAYAVGGASAVLFHAEPINTYDLDLFVLLPEASGAILSMEPLYAALRERGFEPSADHVLIAGVPVQFLPAYNALVEEAVNTAEVHDYDGVPVRVTSAEHLAAIALQTGGVHRVARIPLLQRSSRFDADRFHDLIVRHGLESKWQNYLKAGE